ncbi:hypothetical protein KF840_08910 [bacterium]|nr:hypothetical protein [bacterium]
MNDELFGDRRKANEESYFAKREEELRAGLRGRAEREARRRALAEATGVSDAWILDALLAQGVNERSVDGFILLPLAEVAWADGQVDPAERDAALAAAARHGLAADGLALFETWLAHRPSDALVETWRAFVAARASTVDPPRRDGWRRELLDEARAVARASGGMLGFGSKISGAEEQALRGIQAALS